MDNENDTCPACGSFRVVFGYLNGGGRSRGIWFDLPKDDVRPWSTFLTVSAPVGPAVGIQQVGSALLCLDCGTVSASFQADIDMAIKVVDKFGTEELKSRLDTSDEAGDTDSD